MPERDRYATRKDAGLCVYCGVESAAVGVACPSCAAAQREREAAARADARRRGVCLDCRRAPAEGGLYRCSKCAERQRRRMAKGKLSTTAEGERVTLRVTLGVEGG